MEFIGRKTELAELEANYQMSSGFVVIYGRRRVGKTTLITEFIKNKPALYFLATKEREVANIQNFQQQLAAFTRKDYLRTAPVTDWITLLSLFAEYDPDRKKMTNFSTSQRQTRHFPPSFRKPGTKSSPGTTSCSSSAAPTSA